MKGVEGVQISYLGGRVPLPPLLAPTKVLATIMFDLPHDTGP